MKKIYTEIRIDISSGETLSESSYLYEGEIAECKGGGNYPQPTEAEEGLTKAQTELINLQIAQLTKQNDLLDKLWPDIEKYVAGELEYSTLQLESAKILLPLQEELAKQGIELNTLQIDAIKDQLKRNKALEPVLLEAMGYEKDESGNYVAVEGEQDPLLAQLEERYTKTMAGEEGASPYLESQLADERAKLEEDLSRKLGPNWRSSTPGIQALSDFDTRANLLREETQQSAVASAGSQYLSARGLLAGEKQQEISNISALMGGGTGVTNVSTGIGGGGGIASGLMGGGGGSSASAGISDLRNYYQTNRYNQWAAKEGQSAGRTQAMMGGALGGAMVGAQMGTAGGPYGVAIGAGVGLLAGYLLS